MLVPLLVRSVETRAADGHDAYILPHDEKEHRRLDKLQLVFRVVLGGNVLAPISSTPTNILDVGTGSGAWPAEVAEKFPSAAVRGLDIAPVNRSNSPPNCQYIIANLNDGLPFDDNCMDMVNSRAIMSGVAKSQWPSYMKEAYRILKPGIGWVQCVEFNPFLKCDDDSVPKDAALWKYQEIVGKLYSTMNPDYMLHGEHLENTVTNGGFIDITVKRKHIYLNQLGKDPQLATSGIEAFTTAIPWLVEYCAPVIPDQNERIALADKVIADMSNPEYNLYVEAFLVIGRKPDQQANVTESTQ